MSRWFLTELWLFPLIKLAQDFFFYSFPDHGVDIPDEAQVPCNVFCNIVSQNKSSSPAAPESLQEGSIPCPVKLSGAQAQLSAHVSVIPRDEIKKQQPLHWGRVPKEQGVLRMSWGNAGPGAGNVGAEWSWYETRLITHPCMHLWVRNTSLIIICQLI